MSLISRKRRDAGPMNKLYENEKAPLPKLFRVVLMPPKESLTGDKEQSRWDVRQMFIVRADDPGQASAKAEAFFNAGKDWEYSATEISVYGECTENPDIFKTDCY